MQVRPARPEDAAAIAEVHVRTWQAAYAHVFGSEQLGTLDVEQRRARWAESLASPQPDWGVFVAEEEGRVQGFVSVGASRDDASEGELFAIYLLPEAWGSGAGPALMAAAVEALRDAGYPAAILWVLEDNPRARRFYEREGWTRDGGQRDEEFLCASVSEVSYRITLG